MFNDDAPKQRYFIKTGKGFYLDFLNEEFVESIDDAYAFYDVEELTSVIYGLDLIGYTDVEFITEEIDDDKERLIRLAKQVVDEAKANAAKNPKTDEILVVIVEPSKKPYKKMIPNTLESMQKIVDGYIENVFIGNTLKGARLAITLNEEGKLIELPFNRRIMNLDIIVGTFFITAYNLEGDAVGLSEFEAHHFIKRFSTTEVYL